MSTPGKVVGALDFEDDRTNKGPEGTEEVACESCLYHHWYEQCNIYSNRAKRLACRCCQDYAMSFEECEGGFIAQDGMRHANPEHSPSRQAETREFNAVQLRNSELAQENNNFQSRVDRRDLQIRNLTAANTNLTDDNADLRRRNNILRTHNNSLAQDLDRVRDHRDFLEHENVNLGAANVAFARRVAELENLVARYQSQQPGGYGGSYNGYNDPYNGHGGPGYGTGGSGYRGMGRHGGNGYADGYNGY